MGRPAPDARKLAALPRAGPNTPVEANVGPGPSPRRRRDIRGRSVDHRWRHLVTRQGRGWRPQHDCVRREIAESTPPRRATPVADAFFQNDFRPLGDVLHHGRLAGRSGPHRDWGPGHSQFRACRRDKGDGKAKSKIETHNCPHIFVARHVGPFGPKAGSTRKLSLAVIAPRDKVSSGMTRVA
jgi:hypothetical protein